jgi:hypothetical protein
LNPGVGISQPIGVFHIVLQSVGVYQFDYCDIRIQRFIMQPWVLGDMTDNACVFIEALG